MQVEVGEKQLFIQAEQIQSHFEAREFLPHYYTVLLHIRPPNAHPQQIFFSLSSGRPNHQLQFVLRAQEVLGLTEAVGDDFAWTAALSVRKREAASSRL